MSPGSATSIGGMSAQAASLRAEALGARLPPLLVAAERVASTVAQGVHGRRRVGQGESFWQYRAFVQGDSVNRIDWRQTAKSDRAFIRETEWEAAQTVCLWRDGSPSMAWRSRLAQTDKRDRAGLLLLALASLLLRGGERVALLGDPRRPATGRAGLARLAEAILGEAGRGEAVGTDTGASGLPPSAAPPRHAKVVLIGDFLSPLPAVQQAVARLAAVPVGGHLLQVLDPAEARLPYRGRVRFAGLEAEGEALVPRVESVRAAYADRLAAHQAGLAAICGAAGFGFAVHHTDQPPEAALLALYMAWSG